MSIQSYKCTKPDSRLILAISKRLKTLPIELFAQIFQQVMERINNRQPQNQAVPVNWQPVYQRFTVIWIADGSTLEALRSRSVSQRRKLKALKQQEKTLAGKIMMVVEAFTHRPVTTWYTHNSKANDKTWCNFLLLIMRQEKN